MAIDLAMVLGRTGFMISARSFTIVEIGLHPVAWATYIFVGTPSIRPNFANSFRAL